MNSVQLANKTWKWIVQCSIIPHDEVIKDHMKKIAQDVPDYVLQNASKRLFKRVGKFREIIQEMRDNPGNETILRKLAQLSGNIPSSPTHE